MWGGKSNFWKRFTYCNDSKNFSSLNEAKELFRELVGTKITLEEALKDAGVLDYKSTAKYGIERGKEAKKVLGPSAASLTDDEAGAIVCYTLELEGNSLYKIINSNIVTKRSEKGLQGPKKYIYLFLSGLRKLPRSVFPNNKMLYRGIDTKVPIRKLEAKGHQSYSEGNIVTWWGFTSTSINKGVAVNFMKGSPKKSFFTIKGKGMWGYDIQAFSNYKEGEFLLEPEAKIKIREVNQVTKTELELEVELQPFEHLVLEDVIKVPEEIVEEFVCSTIEDLTAKQDAYGEIVLSWSPVEIEGVRYQVSKRKKRWLSSTEWSTVYDGTFHVCVVKGLDDGAKYEFRVRCKIGEKIGDWSRSIFKVAEKFNVRLATETLVKYRYNPKVCSDIIKRIIGLNSLCKNKNHVITICDV